MLGLGFSAEFLKFWEAQWSKIVYEIERPIGVLGRQLELNVLDKFGISAKQVVDAEIVREEAKLVKHRLLEKLRRKEVFVCSHWASIRL